MLNSVSLENDSDKDYVKLEFEGHDDSSDDEQTPIAQIVQPEIASSTISSTISDSITYAIKQSFIYSAKTIGGCFAAVALAPRAVPVVISYLVPSATVPGVIASTTTASVGVVSFGLGSQVSAKGAEAAWDASSFAVSSAITYLYSRNKTKEKPTEIKDDYESSYGLRP